MGGDFLHSMHVEEQKKRKILGNKISRILTTGSYLLTVAVYLKDCGYPAGILTQKVDTFIPRPLETKLPLIFKLWKL